MRMIDTTQLLTVAAVGLATTSSSMAGVVIGLYAHFSKRVLASVLAFAAGALIGALAIDLAFVGAEDLARLHFSARAAWAFIGGGFAVGATTYYTASRILEQRGAAVRSPARFNEFAHARRRRDTKALIALLSRVSIVRHLPPVGIESLLASIRTRTVAKGEMVFRAGDPGDALFIVSRGRVEVLSHAPGQDPASGKSVAIMGAGEVFGEMALLSGGVRTASIRAIDDLELLEISKDDFEHQISHDPVMAEAVARLSHERAMDRLSDQTTNPDEWCELASRSLDRVSQSQSRKLLTEVGSNAGLAIIFGNILDTIPGCLVIGARFEGLASMSLPLLLGMFFGGIPEAAVSTIMLRKAGYTPTRIVTLWSTVLVAGIVAAVAGNVFLGGTDSLIPIFVEAIAGGAVLGLVSHAMIPEAIHEGGSVVVLPTVAGFLFALYYAIAESNAFAAGVIS
jgi:CRP-like cAMP-binding protein